MRQTKVVLAQNDDNDSKDDRLQKRKLYIKPSIIIDILQEAEDFVEQKEDLINSLPSGRVLKISYEELFANVESKNKFRDQVFRFLGVEKIDIASDHRKISSNNLSDIIENYQEIYDLLIDTKFAKYLD